MPLGAHVSIAGGLDLAPRRGAALRCAAIQIFTKNGSQWAERRVTDDEGAAFRREVAACRVEAVLAHGSYLVNLASPEAALARRSRRAFLAEADRCESLGIPFLVFHPGARGESSESVAVRRIATAIREAAARTPSVTFLLETTAGQGTSIGWRFEHLRDLLDLAGSPDRAGVCFDTAHVHAAGYDLGVRGGFARAIEAFDRVVGWRAIRAFHLNDSKAPVGARVDRHEHLGRGTLGMEAFRALARDSRFSGLPKILETPKGRDPRTGREWDAIHLGRLRRLGMR